jgi:fused signal recognition particle receptor
VVVIVLLLIVAAIVAFVFLRKPATGAQPPAIEPSVRPAAPSAKSARPPAQDASAQRVPSDRPAEAATTAAEQAAPVRATPPPRRHVERRAFKEQRDVASLRTGLSKSRSEEGFFGRIKALLGKKATLSPEIAGEIEEVLLQSDVGVQTTAAILQRVRDGLSSNELADSAKVWAALKQEMQRILDLNGEAMPLLVPAKPTVILMIGVNGAGKTTTIGKLAGKLKAEGHSCVLAAADTFRAAAVAQLKIWGDRIGCEVVSGKEGADPASVVFDAIRKAQETGASVVLADTAGRLHTKVNLMTEMQKIATSAGKALPGAPHETLLVIDATMGQNALAQAREFKEAMPVTGIVLTKLDGTAKGGMAVGISDALGVPIKLIGLGERQNDLHEFIAEDFVEALLGKGEAATG